MSQLWGYSDLYDLVDQRANLRLGIMIDTNLLISATYDLDDNYETTKEFLDLVFENSIPLFCNVTVKSEFLEIHRRIIFSEALVDFCKEILDVSKLPPTLASKITSLRNRQIKAERKSQTIRLTEAEIKLFKMEMLRIVSLANKNLWEELCESRIGDQLSRLWGDSVEEFGLNFLGTRKDDQGRHLKFEPDWSKAMELIESQGLSSADAMIVNMFLSSKFEVLLTSDNEVALAVVKNCKAPQGCIVPERVKSALNGLT